MRRETVIAIRLGVTRSDSPVVAQTCRAASMSHRENLIDCVSTRADRPSTGPQHYPPNCHHLLLPSVAKDLRLSLIPSTALPALL